MRDVRGILVALGLLLVLAPAAAVRLPVHLRTLGEPAPLA